MSPTMPALKDYVKFLEDKATVAKDAGFIVNPNELHPSLMPHQRDMILWALRKGRGLIAASFGLGKTRVQIEMLRILHERTGQKVMVICPLGVRQQFTRMDGPAVGVNFQYVRDDEAISADYEMELIAA